MIREITCTQYVCQDRYLYRCKRIVARPVSVHKRGRIIQQVILYFVLLHKTSHSVPGGSRHCTSPDSHSLPFLPHPPRPLKGAGRGRMRERQCHLPELVRPRENHTLHLPQKWWSYNKHCSVHFPRLLGENTSQTDFLLELPKQYKSPPQDPYLQWRAGECDPCGISELYVAHCWPNIQCGLRLAFKTVKVWPMSKANYPA